MTVTSQFPPGQTVPWFKQWFDSVHYQKLYRNRNQREAADFVNQLIEYLQPSENATMLDLGCGAGRHSKQLASKGFRVLGIDLASSSIREAKKSESEMLRFVRKDMRESFGRNSFDYVFNFFTSFGYFKTEQENDKVITNISKALKPGGVLVLDYLNATYAVQRLQAYEEKEIDGIQYHIHRWSDQKFIYKRIAIDGNQVGEDFETTEQVAKISLHDFKDLFDRKGFDIEEVFGDYTLNTYNPQTSPRLIMVARNRRLK